MIARAIAAELRNQLREFPILTFLGPRQAGKTTWAKLVLPDWDYASLGDPQIRTIAEEDQKGLLERYHSKVIFDEIHL